MSQQQQQRRMMVDAYEEAVRVSSNAAHLSLPEGTSLYEIPNNGVSYLDFFPYVVQRHPKHPAESITYNRPYYLHRNMGIDGKQAVICLRAEGLGDCPICAQQMALSAKHGRADKDKAKAIKELAPKHRVLFIVSDLENPNKGLQILDVSYSLFPRLLFERIAKSNPNDRHEANWRNFAVPDNGMSLKITWRQEQIETVKYWEAASIDFRPREQQYDFDQTVDMMPCLDLVLNIPTPDSVAALLASTPNDLMAASATAPQATTAPAGAPPRRLPPAAIAAPAPGTARPAAAPPRAAVAPATAPPAASIPDPPMDDDDWQAVAVEEAVYTEEAPFEEPAPEPAPAPSPARPAAPPRPAAAAPAARPAAAAPAARPAAAPAARPATAAPAAAPAARPAAAAPAARPAAAPAARPAAAPAARPAAAPAAAPPAAGGDFAWD